MHNERFHHHSAPDGGRQPFGWECAEHTRSRYSGPQHGGPDFGGPGFGGPGFGGRRGHGPGGHGPRAHGRARRGDTRLAILSLLSDEASNGYGIIKRIAERTDDSWRPSPGSIYPTLQQLTEEGLIAASAADGAHELTAAGKKYVAEHADEIAHIWDARPHRGEHGGIRDAAEALFGVIGDFRHATAGQRQAAIQELTRTRKALFRILADDEPVHPDAPSTTDAQAASDSAE
ncbi:PadR family transcriptional regulator [Pseudoclavibacter sp. 13-3]|uniref:PadR family transcriptional regulator n=1 Tax=Pseudoclavibacter sp. 13-3 TaxID=2901228 RepID=UPI001E42DE4A|nr:PadR family transcriptional regulator [Pseudoclavibacter sp. 13-3]MCD7100702.1 PadR family transcriptional regulator [Pseudoclavibacter sp. 13-3]